MAYRFDLTLDRKLFEYDIYALLRSFYPMAEITILYEGEEALPSGGADAVFSVHYETGRVCFLYRGDLPSAEDLPEGRSFFEGPVTSYEDRIRAKNEVKHVVYRALCTLTGRELPWGDLTGIRPTKIAMKMIEDGCTDEEAVSLMRERYFTGEQKARLAVRIARRERALLDELDPASGYSLYIGIPFCTSICLYCSFGSHPLERWKHLTGPYLDTLEKELRFIRSRMEGRRPDTVYIGGGTPSSLEAEQIGRLLKLTSDLFCGESLKEFTFEAGRPDTITREKLDVIRSYPVTRISVNPQTMNQKTLDLIGRRHTTGDIIRTFEEARACGFDNINMDLIVGLPGEGMEEVGYTLSEVEKLRPDSLTVHSLALKRATRLNLFRDQYTEISFDNSGEIMRMTEESAAGMGLLPYYLYRQKDMAGNFENVGYAAPGKEGLYNVLIMEEKQTIMAAGAGASTKFVFDGGQRIERAENVKDLTNYIGRIDEMLLRKQSGIEKYL